MRRAFLVIALSFTLGALYHLAGALTPALGIAGSRRRHAAFVGIDLVTAWYMVRRPLWLLPAFLVLVGQQVPAHGRRLWRWWQEGRGVDWISVLALGVLAAGLGLVLWDAWGRLRRARAATPHTPPAA